MDLIQVKIESQDKERLQQKAESMRLALSSYCRLKLIETLNAEK